MDGSQGFTNPRFTNQILRQDNGSGRRQKIIGPLFLNSSSWVGSGQTITSLVQIETPSRRLSVDVEVFAGPILSDTVGVINAINAAGGSDSFLNASGNTFSLRAATEQVSSKTTGALPFATNTSSGMLHLVTPTPVNLPFAYELDSGIRRFFLTVVTNCPNFGFVGANVVMQWFFKARFEPNTFPMPDEELTGLFGACNATVITNNQ